MNGRLTGHGFQRTWETKDGDERSSWAYAVERGRVDGRRLTPLTRGPYRTQKEAATALRDELGAREAGTWIEPTRQTVGEWFSGEWVPSLAEAQANGKLRATTRDLYERIVRLHIEPKPFGQLPIQTLHPRDVRDLFARLRTEGSEGGRGPLGPGGLHNVRTVLHRGLKQAQGEGIVARNVVALVDPPARTRPDEDDEERRHWTAAMVAQFLDYVDAATLDGLVVERRKRKGKEYEYKRNVPADPMLRAVLYLLAYTGMRRGEACGLRWENVDLEKGTVRLRDTRVMVSGKVARSKTKTERGNRLLRIDPDVIEALRAWRTVQNEQRMRFRKHWDDDRGHVFTHEVRFSKPVRYGVAIRPDWLSAKFRQYARGAELPPLRLHGLRHSAVTNAAENGASSRDIADAMGHSSQAVTERYYRHTFERVQETALAQVAGAIKQARGGGA